jgi:TPP-dependent indolepyruvate ferredoxin oxidoreductase alpha subunit
MGNAGQKVPKGEIGIDETTCLGCGYCEKYYIRGYVAVTPNKFSPQEYLLPVFANPERCTACGMCSWICPHFPIEVYKYVESTAKLG